MYERQADNGYWNIYNSEQYVSVEKLSLKGQLVLLMYVNIYGKSLVQGSFCAKL